MGKKRGQIVLSHAVAYVILIVIVGVIFIMGYRYIGSAKKIISTSELLSFETKLSSDIKIIGKDYGRFKKIAYSLPEKLNEVCFTDLGKKSEILTSKLISSYPTIKDSIGSDLKNNVFFVGNVEKHSYNAGLFEINHYPYFNCFKVNKGKIEVGIEGFGDRALVLADFVTSLRLDPSRETTLKSADGVITLTFQQGTSASLAGANVDRISIEMIDPSFAPVNYGGSDVYKFSPSGAIFSRAVELRIKYNPAIVG
ncbi:hypothetical protein HYY71_00995 [Candidatus Woesearchaeota archaeon]|nr:hypothetical protein [Candidatus Woesearchaeota archaeon]